MKKMLLVIGFVCFSAVFGFGFTEQSFAQQDSQLTAEVEEFTDKDEMGLEKAIKEERWETVIFYREKQQRYYSGKAKEMEAEISCLKDIISKKGSDPLLVSMMELQMAALILRSAEVNEFLGKSEELIKESKRRMLLQKNSPIKSI